MSEKEMQIVEDMPDFCEETTTTPKTIKSTDELVIELMTRQATDGWDMNRCVEYYIKTMADNDPVFAKRVADKSKSAKGCIDYITSEARKTLKSNGVVADIVCYGWAMHYYQESNEALGIKKESKPVATTTKTKTETPVKPQETTLFSQSTDETDKVSNVVLHPSTAKKLTARELKRGDDCYSLFEF